MRDLCREKRGRMFAAIILTLIIAGTTPQPVSAIMTAKITVDAGRISVPVSEAAVITGTVRPAKGQRILVFAEDGKTELGGFRTGNSGKTEHFRVKIPSKFLPKNAEMKIFLQSSASNGLAASRKVPVTLACGAVKKGPAAKKAVRKAQKIKAPAKITLTNVKGTAKIKAAANTGRKLTYRSSAPSVVSVNKKGKLKRKKNGKAVITIRQAGNGKYLPAEKKVKVVCRKSTRKEQVDAAVAWALKIAKDNRFTYGSGRGAHHNGCYFCGTNCGPRKHMKPGRKYKRTYCCNPFIHAAYAHGAKNPRMLAGCRRASGIGMEIRTFTKFGCWKYLGKPPYRKLRKGDVLVNHSHVAMYVGKHRLVEASGGNWSASSIAARHMSKSRYRGFSFVMRYTGY